MWFTQVMGRLDVNLFEKLSANYTNNGRYQYTIQNKSAFKTTSSR